MKNPLITVALAVYNPQKEYFDKCMETVLNQTYKNLQIILVDDGSNFETARICDKYAGADKRIDVLHKKNGGLSSARNAGIEAAKGEYIVFVDSDDYLEPDMVERLFEKISGAAADIGVCTWYSFTADKRKDCYYVGPDCVVLDRDNVWKYNALMLDSFAFKELQYGLCMTSWGKMFSVKLLNDGEGTRFDEHMLDGAEDQDFMHRLLVKAQKMVIFNEKLYWYRQHGLSLTKTYKESFADKQIGILKIIHNDIKNDERLMPFYEKHCLNLFLTCCLSSVFHSGKSKSYGEKRRCIKELVKKEIFAEVLKKVNKSDWGIFKYIFFMSAGFGMYSLALLLLWACDRKYRRDF